MIAFWLISALLAAGALLWVLRPLLASRTPVRVSRSATNLAIHRDHLRELDADLRSGALEAEDYQKARRELEARLLEDLRDGDAAPAAQRRHRGAAIAAGVAIPLFALGLYFVVGNPLAIVAQGQSEAAHESSGQQIEAMVARLAARMTQNPENTEGWLMLGRSYKMLSRFNEAAEAYANVAARVLEADPGHLNALALAGSAAFEKQDYAGAIRYWERMLPRVPQDSDTARALQDSIAEARSLGVR